MEENGTNPKTREMAERLLAYEAAAQHPSEADGLAASRVCQKLSHPLGKLIGTEGYRAILRRALTLARREAEGLNAVKITDEGLLESLNGEAEKVSAVLVTNVIELLLTFLGEPLTLKLVHDVWPEGTDLKHSAKGSKHERTKWVCDQAIANRGAGTG